MAIPAPHRKFPIFDLNQLNYVCGCSDPPAGEEEWEAVEGGFTCALDLVTFIRKTYGDDYFCLAVAGYPEGHPKVIKDVADPEKLTEAEKARLVKLEDKYYVCHDEVRNTYNKSNKILSHYPGPVVPNTTIPSELGSQVR